MNKVYKYSSMLFAIALLTMPFREKFPDIVPPLLETIIYIMVFISYPALLYYRVLYPKRRRIESEEYVTENSELFDPVLL
jgi:hypothetical protein